ncbi:hypothetical protein HAV15_004219 [Penicillium sp. str. |nr:hypothetical protein HAV15_004219 [Penicillium sp. str. \
MTQFDFTGSETQRRGWDQCDGLAPNEQSEPDPKRQCMEQSWTNQEAFLDQYSSFSNVAPIIPAQDPGIFLSSEDFEDLVPASNLDLMDFFNVKNEDSSNLVQKSSGFCLETPQAPDPTQYLPTPNSNYDSPEIITSASCHSLPDDTGVFLPVNIQVVGDILKLFGGKANRNVGLLNLPTLGKLMREFTVTFSAKCEKKAKKDKRQSLGYQNTPVHIIIYGLHEDMNEIGNALSEGGLFLQHPTEGEASVPYKNSQFLMSPGTEMPQIKNLANGSLSTAFETVDGPAEFDPVEPSPCLRTKLKEHQIKALSMMTEKERGVIDEADFPSLWEIHRDFDGNVRYRHAVIGITQNIRPQPPAGGILADEMGLGKTLSVLALIAWYLDGLPLERTGPSTTTLIITTLSNISGEGRSAQLSFMAPIDS